MAYFAELNPNNMVLRVLAVANDMIKDEQGNEQEQIGIDFLKSLFGSETIWKQTSYNTSGGVHTQGGTPLRKNYAGIGYTYDSTRDAFIPPKPYNSWVLNETSCLWGAPTPMPNDGKIYSWDEETTTWIEISSPQ